MCISYDWGKVSRGPLEFATEGETLQLLGWGTHIGPGLILGRGLGEKEGIQFKGRVHWTPWEDRAGGEMNRLTWPWVYLCEGQRAHRGGRRRSVDSWTFP